MTPEYGHFDDHRREYVITRPDTPWPWINYLGTQDFFSLISNTAGGYSFCRDAKYRRITRYRYNGVPMDAGGRYFYINDQGTVWNPGWKPCRTSLDRYECRHGLNYTRIIGEKNGIEANALFFVPLDAQCEITLMTLTNHNDTPRTFKLFSFQEWCLWNASTDMENFQRNLSTGEVEIEGSTIYHTTEYRERRDHYAFYHVNQPISGFDTDREAFLGAYNGFDTPAAVVEAASRDSVAHGWSPIASHCLEITLQPGESRDIVFLLGYVENPHDQKWQSPGVVNKQKAKDIIARFDTADKALAAFNELRAYWDDLLSNFTIECCDKRLERMVNVWNQYQCMVTFCMSRSASYFESGIGRGMGFRDSNQDLCGFVHLIPQRARQRILDIAATQRADGSCYHQYQPLTKRGNNEIGSGFNDDPMWLVFGTVAYIRETGDTTILDEMVPYDNAPGTEVPLKSHLKASFNHVVNHLGPHGLPLIGRADWNDCLNLNCFSSDPDESFQTTENHPEGSQAESLMIAGQFVMTGSDYASLLLALGDKQEALWVMSAVQAMEKSITRYGWDGEYYLRAYDFNGQKVGSHENKEGKIFIESQGWCAMAGAGSEKGYPRQALDAVKRYLDTPHGIVLNQPPFTSYDLSLGEITTYPPGYKENAGIFCHNNPWIVIAEALHGDKDRAWEYWRKTAPAYISNQQLHKVEPYVYCQMIAGKDASLPGEGKNSWLTGTAAWSWLALTQYLLGIRPQFDGLEIDPSLPADLDSFTVERKFRGADYKINVKRTGSRSLSLNGKPITGTIPAQPSGSYNVINATI